MRRSKQQGLSLLEFTLVAMIFSVLVAVALERIATLRVDLERAAVNHAVTNMRAALAVRFAELIVRGEEERILAWEGGNALRLLGRGESAEDASIGVSGPGQWSYREGQIRYRPAYPQALTGDPAAMGRWRVEVLGTREDPTGLTLRTVEPLLVSEDGNAEKHPEGD